MAKEKEITENDNTKLSEIVTNLNKKYGQGTIVLDKIIDIQRFSSGSFTLDRALGGGWARGRIIEILGAESSGKAQPLYSKILTPSGWKLMRDIEIGDIVCAPDGGNTTIVGVFPQGKKQIYRVIFDDKSFADCTEEHLWLVYQRESNLGEVLSTKELMEKGLKRKNSCRKFKIPIVKQLEFNGHKDLPIDPYLLGLLLGDGSFRGPTIKFSTIEQELLDNISAILSKDFPEMTISAKMGDCDYHLKKKEFGKKRTRLYELLEKLGLTNKLSQDKFIPEEYLFASIFQRTALLQGLIDSDGSIDSDGGTSFSTSSPKLSQQFEFLVRSLGFRCVTSSRITKYTSSTGNKVDGLPSFRSSLITNSSDICPARLTRKKCNLSNNLSSYRFRFIESIEKIDIAECQCIKVGHPDGLYITNDFIVTHNTTITLHAAAEVQKAGGRVLFVDCEHAIDGIYSAKLGVNMDQLIVSQPYCGEHAVEVIDEFAKSGMIDLIIVDSVAAMTPKAELDGDMLDAHMGLHARLMSKAMRVITGVAAKTETTVMLTNQFRQKITMYGDGKTTTGGNALKFYASQRLELTRVGKPVEVEGEPVGIEVNAKVIKNKTAPPFKETSLRFMYGVGIDKELDILRLALTKDVISRAGAGWLTYGDKKLQGEDKFLVFLKEHPEEMDKIKSLL